MALTETAPTATENDPTTVPAAAQDRSPGRVPARKHSTPVRLDCGSQRQVRTELDAVAETLDLARARRSVPPPTAYQNPADLVVWTRLVR